MIAVTQTQKRALGIATAIAILLGAYFLKHYALMIVFALIVAFTFNPVYKKLLIRGYKPGKAASLTLLTTFFAIIIPLSIVLVITGFQLSNLIDGVKSTGANSNFNELLSVIINQINTILNNLGLSYQISSEVLKSQLSTALTSIGQNLATSIASFVGSIGSIITTSIIYVYVFISVLVNQDKLADVFHQINPLGKQISDLYVKRAGLMTKSMVRGQFIIAIVQGFTDALFLYIAGLRSTFFFFFMLLTVLSIIPLGGGVVVIPIGIIMILTGNIWQGALVLAGHILIVGNEDNILRPKLVPAEARLDPALTLLSVFSGLAFFGFLGIVIGPVIMILIVTTIQVYLEVYKNIKSVESTNKSNTSALSKIKFWKRNKSTTKI